MKLIPGLEMVSLLVLVLHGVGCVVVLVLVSRDEGGDEVMAKSDCN